MNWTWAGEAIEADWAAQYRAGDPTTVTAEFPDMVTLFRRAVETKPSATLIRYLGASLQVADVDRQSSALAGGLAERGIGQGDRVALFLQNTPAFVVSVLAVWKLGAVVVPVNPMLKADELRFIIEDSGARSLVTYPSLYPTVAAARTLGFELRVILTQETDYGASEIPAAFAPPAIGRTGELDGDYLVDVIEAHRYASPKPVTLMPDDPAVLTYTSGTTGPPKGAVQTHSNLTFNVESSWRWIGLDHDDVVLAVAPLFHITGFVLHLCMSLRGPLPLILTYRFHATDILATIERERPTFAIGAITAFIALLSAVRADTNGPAKCRTLTKVCSGGAPVPPSVALQFASEVGPYIRNMYGLTETTSAVTGVPAGRSAPVDEASGALSVGVPIYSTAVVIVDEDDKALPRGQIGELLVLGPQVMPGYWNRPDESARALRGGALHTGDVAFMDEDGWVYLVDRKKDLIISSGYKIWPREVEDVLYKHPAVREAGVVGEPDAYRGEAVVAYVSLSSGAAVTEEDLVNHCRERIAVYKVPRRVSFVDDLPKTPTGKILRRSLRVGASETPAPSSTAQRPITREKSNGDSL